MGVASRAEFLKASFDRGCEASIAEVAVLFDLPETEHPFELCIAVQTLVEMYGIQLVPPLPKGSDQSPRLFCCPQDGLSPEDVRTRVAAGEGATTEFKSSMLFCVNTFAKNPAATKAELRSDGVTHSVMKTVAAFLNTSGGSLYVGVDDKGATVGLEQDFTLLGGDVSRDAWELKFRELVSTGFIDGKTVNNMIRVGFTQMDGLTVAHVSVAQRAKISYLKSLKSSAHEVYVRQGNRTVSLTFPEFEEYLRAR